MSGRALYDTLGNGVSEGTVVQGFGLRNAGRYYTVLRVSETTRGRILLEEHLTRKKTWTFLTYYRAVQP